LPLILCLQVAEETQILNVPGVVPDALKHLSQPHQQYFLQWSLMLRLEYEESVLRKRNLSDIWTMEPRIREASGTCLSNLKVEDCWASQFHTSELDEYSITLGSVDGSDFPRHLQFQRGDSVVLSTDTEIAIATGCLVGITTNSVTIATDRNLTYQERACRVRIT
jgi:DNA replication ATP-dependent helicase Dna2